MTPSTRAIFAQSRRDSTVRIHPGRDEALEAEVTRLREENDIISEMLTEWKARATALEEALRAIADDCEADYPPSHGAIKHAARRALAQKE